MDWGYLVNTVALSVLCSISAWSECNQDDFFRRIDYPIDIVLKSQHLKSRLENKEP